MIPATDYSVMTVYTRENTVADSLAEVAKMTFCAKLITPRVGVKSINEFLPLTATVRLNWYPPVHKEPLVC